MEKAQEETRVQQILRALEEMTKDELVVLCQNLEKTIRNRDDEIDRINGHYEHLLSLYYEAEEKLALLNQELFLSRAQTHSSLEWSAALTSGGSEPAGGDDTFGRKATNADGPAECVPNAEAANKPPANPRHKTKSGIARKKSDFLSKTMTPVLHRRTSAQQRAENACAKSTPHAPFRSEAHSQLTSSWSEPLRHGECRNQDDDIKTTKRPPEEESPDDSSAEEYDDEELSRDKGITINDVNILKIHHARDDIPDDDPDTDDAQECNPAEYGTQPVSRVQTPFYSERPLTAETAGSDGSRPATGEKRDSTEDRGNEFRDKGTSKVGLNSDNSGQNNNQKLDARVINESTGGVAWSLDVNETPYQTSPSVKKKSAAGNSKVKKNPKESKHRPSVSKSVNFVAKTTNMPVNENRNSHNNNTPSPGEWNGTNTPLNRKSVAVGYGVSEMPENKSGSEMTSVWDGYAGHLSDSTSRGTSPSLPSMQGTQRSVSLDTLPTSDTSANQGEGPMTPANHEETPLTSQRPVTPANQRDGQMAPANHGETSMMSQRSVSDLFRFATLNMKCVDELDGLYRTPRHHKIRANRGAVFGSYDSLRTVVDTDNTANSQGARYPTIIPHVPTEPKRPHTSAPVSFRRRSKSLNQTFPPKRSTSAQTSTRKPPPGAFDFSKLRQRNRAVLMKGPVVVEKPIEHSPGPLRITPIRRPLAASCDTTETTPGTSYNHGNGLRRQPLHSSLDNLHVRDLPPCLDTARSVATPSI